MGRKKKHTDSDIILEVYRRMYKEADPPADIDELIEQKVTIQDRWFMNYVLDDKRQYEIIEETLKEFRVPKYRWRDFKFSIILGAAPTTIPKNEQPPTT